MPTSSHAPSGKHVRIDKEQWLIANVQEALNLRDDDDRNIPEPYNIRNTYLKDYTPTSKAGEDR